MGSYSKSNFGEIEGKVGEAVASKWRGKKVMRSLPGKRKKGASLLQQAVQAKLILSAAKLSPIKDVLDIGFGDKKLTGITGYNAAVRAFINGDAITGDYPDFIVDYSKIKLSRNTGNLERLIRVTVELTEDGLSIVWGDRITKKTALSGDEVQVVVYNETTEFYTVEDSAIRKDCAVTIDPDVQPGEVIHIWIFCANHEYERVSKTQYLGSFSLEQNPS